MAKPIAKSKAKPKKAVKPAVKKQRYPRPRQAEEAVSPGTDTSNGG